MGQILICFLRVLVGTQARLRVVQLPNRRTLPLFRGYYFYSRASCEARPQHYVIILQSQPISCTRRTFLSFFLHHFDEYTEDKLLFKANLPAFFESFHLRLTMFSQYYDSFRIISFFCSNVFYSSLPVIP